MAEPLFKKVRDRRDEEDADDALRFARDYPALTEVTGVGSDTPPPVTTIPGLQEERPKGLGFQGEEKPQATYTDLVLKGLNIGEGGVSFEDIKEAGGLGEIFGEERMVTPGVREVSGVLSTLLGETTSTQRSTREEEGLSPWQKGLLFVSDMVAAFDGRTMPSLQLKAQYARSFDLQDQQNREGFIKGTEAVADFNEQLMRLPIESRMRFAIQQSARLRKDFGEGFGALLITQAAEPSRAEAFETFRKNVKVYEGGASDILMKYVAYLTGAGDVTEAQRVFSEQGLGTGKEPGAFEMDARYHAPALLESKLDGFMGELRRFGGNNAALAEDIATGEQVSPSEIINANDELPVNSPFKLDKSVIRAMRTDPGMFAAVLPGMVSAEQQIEEQVALNNAERSLPMVFIGGKRSDVPGRKETAPSLGKRAAWLMDNGYHRLDQVMDNLAGLGGGMSDSNLIRLGADFIKESGSFEKLNAAFHVVEAALQHHDPAGNMAAIFKFNKVLDEISVVREGEQRATAQARSRLDAIKTWMRRNITGETLTDTQRVQFLAVVTSIWSEAAHEQARREGRWQLRLDGLKVPRNQHNAVIVDLIGPDRSRFDTSGEEESVLQGVAARFQ